MTKLLFYIVGIVELLIGISTFVSVFAVQTWGICGLRDKTLNLYVFVLVTAVISFVLGLGMIFQKKWARRLLLFFSGYVVIVKMLVYSNLMTMNS